MHCTPRMSSCVRHARGLHNISTRTRCIAVCKRYRIEACQTPSYVCYTLSPTVHPLQTPLACTALDSAVNNASSRLCWALDMFLCCRVARALESSKKPAKRSQHQVILCRLL